MNGPKKLIEVAMPIKEISAESVRDKSIRHGHISTLHLWWARRPLPVCRAVVFASLVPDPLDEGCPQAFKDAIELLLGKESNFGDPYHPYKDIPWTSVYDPMEDNLRNRLQMFIGKFTEEMQQHLLHQKPKPGANNQLSDNSLIKWDNKSNETIINKARKLIWVAHNSSSNNTAKASSLLADFDKHYATIKSAEEQLYSISDRHNVTENVIQKMDCLKKAIELFLDKMPRVFDPFAGGGAIPLEAARLGCRSFGNDINPVAHIIQKGSLEFPQRFGKPITYSKAAFIKLYGPVAWNELTSDNLVYKSGEAIAVNIPNRLSFDVEFYAKKLLVETEKEIGYLYPPAKKGSMPIAYYWARVGTCSNPSCKAEIPLLKSFYLANTNTKQVYLKPLIKEKTITFEIKKGVSKEESWLYRGNVQCPICGNSTDVNTLKQQFVAGKTSERLIAVICEGKDGKEYRLPMQAEIDIIKQIPKDVERPSEVMPVKYTQALPSCTWGISKWSDMFTNRQIAMLQKLNASLNILKAELSVNTDDYSKAILCYLGIFIDRIAVANTSFGIWHSGRETLERIMGRQAISMVFDYPESNPFCNSSGSALNQLDWITRYIENECQYPFSTVLQNASSGEKSQFPEKYLTAVVTDPPYYDAIAYADLSDFFYVWLKRTLGDVFPLNFATPQTPKSEECTALKHHHNGDAQTAKNHFENKLLQIFDAIEHQTTDLVSIMFAHQSTEAWTTLCNSILGARMNITGSWATDTEMTGALKTDKSFLSSSVTVSCKPTIKKGVANFKSIEKEIRIEVEKEVELLYSLGFRGADLLTACFGQAVSIFGKYERVERGDGEQVTVAKLLEIAKESAFNALLKGFDGDDFTKFYIGWLQLYSFAESDFDDAAKFSRVGLSINVADLFSEHILIKNGNKQTLGSYEQRLKLSKNLGEKPNSFLIDQVHRAMALYKGTNRALLLKYIDKVASQPESSFWRVVTSLCEVLPAGGEDHKQGIGLLTNKDSLIRESKTVQVATTEQTKLFE
jgi:putative DNA methylase